MEMKLGEVASMIHPFSSKPLPFDKPIPCRHCHRSYKAVNVRDLHERIHLSPYICDYCNQAFALKSHIRNHLEIHRRMIDPYQKVKKNAHNIRFKADASKFTCEFCQKHFYSKLGYTLHLKQKHYVEVGHRTDMMEPENVFIKEEEGDVDDESDGFDWEEEDEEKLVRSRDFVCSCGEKFQEFIDLVRHESNKHSEGFEKMVKGLKDLLLYVINRVGNEPSPKKEKFISIKKEEEIEVEPIIDDFHHESDENDSEMNVSVKSVKKETPTKTRKQRTSVDTPPRTKSQQKPEKYLCQYCDKQLAHKKSLEYHVAKKHQNIPIFRCKFCNRYFTNEEEYRTHLNSHENDPELCCSSCGFLCKGSSVLRRHIAQKHTQVEQEPRFFCQTCGKGFYYKCKLDEHLIIHKPQQERDKVFGCDICSMAFTRKSALNRHKLSHDESTKIYTCIFCSKTFRRKQHLDAHLAMHTGARAREEVCKECGAVYSERRGLYNHMLRVHGKPLEGYRKQNGAPVIKQI